MIDQTGVRAAAMYNNDQTGKLAIKVEKKNQSVMTDIVQNVDAQVWTDSKICIDQSIMTIKKDFVHKGINTNMLHDEIAKRNEEIKHLQKRLHDMESELKQLQS